MDIQQYFQRFLANYTPYKKYWNYEDGCVLKGCIDLYHATGDVLYRDFVLDYVSAYVAADGIFGPQTEAAVKAAQRHFGLTPNGVVGPLLWYAIAEYYYYNV